MHPTSFGVHCVSGLDIEFLQPIESLESRPWTFMLGSASWGILTPMLGYSTCLFDCSWVDFTIPYVTRGFNSRIFHVPKLYIPPLYDSFNAFLSPLSWDIASFCVQEAYIWGTHSMCLQHHICTCHIHSSCVRLPMLHIPLPSWNSTTFWSPLDTS